MLSESRFVIAKWNRYEIAKHPGLRSDSPGCFSFLLSCLIVCGQRGQKITKIAPAHEGPTARPDNLESSAAQLAQRMFSQAGRLLKKRERIRGVVAYGSKLIGFCFLSHVWPFVSAIRGDSW